MQQHSQGSPFRPITDGNPDHRSVDFARAGGGWHDFRHDFVSRLVVAGVPINTVRDLLGHADITMTLR
ncbi:tyrosine-type recombinase/integrase [Caballeronia sp. LjRoot31]